MIMSRTQNTIKNVTASMTGQVFAMLIGLVSRAIFLKFLSAEYLGLNSLFASLLTALSLIELGVGPAISFSLYKPLAEKNYNQVKALMKMFRKAYIGIGIAITVIGLLITPFLNIFIAEIPKNIDSISIIFILFLLNTSVSYFFSYKQVLLIADQKKYIPTMYHYLFYFFANVAQIVGLYLTKNYFVYLIIQVCFTFLENYVISIRANKEFPFLKNEINETVDSETKETILRNVKAMLIHKVGGITTETIDQLLISGYFSLTSLGIYSNYALLIKTAQSVLGQVFNSLTPSVGNLTAVSEKNKVYDVFNMIFSINAWSYGFASVGFFVFIDQFIRIWLGEGFFLDKLSVIIIIVNFYLQGMRSTVLTFKAAGGIYWQDRFRPLMEAIINLVVSILLVKRIGIAGIFLGTFISKILVTFWIEPKILFHEMFQGTSLASYYFKYLKNTLFSLLQALFFYVLFNLDFWPMGASGFLARLVLFIIVSNLAYFIFFKYSGDRAAVDFVVNTTKKTLRLRRK